MCAAALCGWGVLTGDIAGPAAETAIPNDWFAVETAASEDAAEAMMLKIVCLTFDDGPSSNTPAILKVLADRDVPATFFVTAQEVNQDYLPLLADIEAAGHQVALHSASHRYSRIYASPEDFWLDSRALRAGHLPLCGGGEHPLAALFPAAVPTRSATDTAAAGFMTRLIAQAEDKGYQWIDWNVSAEDAAGGHPDAEQILANIQADAEGRDLCVGADARHRPDGRHRGGSAPGHRLVPRQRLPLLHGGADVSGPGRRLTGAAIRPDFRHPAQCGNRFFWQTAKVKHGVTVERCVKQPGFFVALGAGAGYNKNGAPMPGMLCRARADGAVNAKKEFSAMPHTNTDGLPCAACWGR